MFSVVQNIEEQNAHRSKLNKDMQQISEKDVECSQLMKLLKVLELIYRLFHMR